jgi:WD40 repeat protein
MAPCQARGEPTNDRSDLFSLGAVLYTLCTGRRPFGGDTTVAVLQSVCEDTPPPIRALRPDIPRDLCDLIDRLLAKDPRERLGSAREVAELLTGQLARAQRSLPPRSASWRTSLLLACLVLLLGVAALVAVLKPWQRWGAGPGAGDTTGRERRPPAKPLDLRREDIPPALLALAGGGDPAHAPRELAAVLGDARFLLPRVGKMDWMDASSDGKLLAVPLEEDVALFDAHTGEYLRSLKGPGGQVAWVTFSRDSHLLAATTWNEGKNDAVRVWDLRTDQEWFTNPMPGPKISAAAAFSADAKHLVGEGGERLFVWETRSGQEVQTVELRPGGVASLCFSPDGQRLAVALWWGQGVKVFDWDGEKLGAVRMLVNRLPVGAVVYSPDGKLLASGDKGGFRLWSAESLDELRPVATPAQQLAFAPDSRTLFAAWTNGVPRSVHTFTRWDVVARQELPPLSVELSAEPTFALHCLSRDGKVLFVARGWGCVRALDTATGKDLFLRQGHSAPLNAVAISPDGRTLASAGEDRVVKLWDLATGRVRHTLSGHADAVLGLAFSPDGSQLASGGRNGTIILWDAENGAELRRLKRHTLSPSRAQFSPDGRTLAVGGEGGFVELWDLADGRERYLLTGHAGVVRCVAFSADGKWLASGGEDRTVCLHDLAEGGERKFAAPNAINVVAFSPNGRTLAAVGDAPEAVRRWDLATGQETAWRDHTGPVHGLAFSPAEPIAATSSEDGTVRLWDGKASAVPRRTIGLGPFSGGIRDVAFTPDGRYLATANANGTVYLLRVASPLVSGGPSMAPSK